MRPPLDVQREPLSAGVRPGTGSRRDTPPVLGPVSMETIQETHEILIFANGRIAQLVSNGRSVSINDTWLQLPVMEQVQEEVSYGFQRWCPEVHLIPEAPLCKNGPLFLIDGSG